MALAAENYIFALYFFTTVYFSIGLLMLLFGSALMPIQMHYGGPATVAGIFGVITGIGYATIAFAPFATLLSIVFYLSVIFFLFRAARIEEERAGLRGPGLPPSGAGRGRRGRAPARV
jgi:uncharacterized membrane protein